MMPAHAQRYFITDEGLTRYVQDFYSYRIADGGKQDSPLGSHVNAHTAGGLAEGGYLGFAELQYVHMPLRGEYLVAFLSDGAFEEQRGSDWAPRWWRGDDCGLVAPIMIKNGRRIDQKTTMSQQGGITWFRRHLELNGFDPIVFDGRDPSAFVWAIFEIERRLQLASVKISEGTLKYPVRLPYGVAVAPKGYGFPGAGTNLAHNLPLMTNPYTDNDAAERFNRGAKQLWVAQDELKEAIRKLQEHERSGRPREKDHALLHRDVSLGEIPSPQFCPVENKETERGRTVNGLSPMAAVDKMFAATVRANPHLRPRVGNPDEMRSNRLVETLDLLKFRVTDPEPGVPESLGGAVITALNEEAIASAALANKAGINLIHTYEAFGTKMHGVVRQEIIFANHCNENGRPQRWLSVPLILTSHTWENGKNEQSHQDPSMAESMLGELAHISRVIFPADFNTAAAVMERIYQTHGQIWTLVVPKADTVANLFTPDDARRIVNEGGLSIQWTGHGDHQAEVSLVAVGAYQLGEVLRASQRLTQRQVPHSVVYLLEPGRFRLPRNKTEEAHLAPAQVQTALFPENIQLSVLLTHTRPEPLVGLLAPFRRLRAIAGLGYINQGGTYDTSGLLFVNRCSWAHCVAEVARLIDLPQDRVLDELEVKALAGELSPEGIIIPKRESPAT
jgi:phosphoketolase